MTRYGPRLVLTSCLGLAALTTQLTYTLLATSLPSLCLGFALTGGLLAPCWPAVTSSLSASFPDKALNSVFGFANSATFAGGLAGTALASYLLEFSGWRSVGLPPALLTLLASLLVSLLLYSPAERGLKVPGKASVQSETRDEEKTVESKSLLSLLRIPCVAEVSCAMFSLKFVRYCMAMWLPLYLLEELGYSKLQAGIFSTVFDVGGIIGAPVLGIALDRFASDRPLLGVSLLMVLGTVVTGLFALTASWGILFNSVFLLVAGAANSGPDSILAGSVSVRLGERSYSSRSEMCCLTLFLTLTMPAWSVPWHTMLRPLLSSSQVQPGMSLPEGQVALTVFTSNLGICGPTLEMVEAVMRNRGR